MKINTKIIVIIIASIVTLSIAYYFIIVLPQYNQNKIDIQQQKIDIEYAEKLQERKAEASRSLDFEMCMIGARETYWNYVKLNGTDLGEREYRATALVWSDAAKRQKNAENTCVLKYGK